MVLNMKGIEIDTFAKPIAEKDSPSNDASLRQAHTPKHCNKGGASRTQGTAVPSFQPRPYPAYGHSQHAFRPPAGLYNPNQRGQNGAAGYYGAPVMVSPGGYMRAGGSYPYGGGAGGSEAEYAHVHAHAQQFGQYAAGHRYPMYGTDMNNRSTYDPRKQSSGAQSGMDFSRTVSASFGENTSKSSNENKGRNEKESLDALHKFNAYYNRKAEDEESIGSKADSDRSWKLLNQVASIEEEKFRHEEAGRLGATSPIDEHLDSEKTNGSSRFTNMPTPSKLASLNSLSSVASAQEPLDTSNSKDELDLIQCASSGSLLFTTHDDTYAKRGREEREDRQDSVRGGEDELRRATSGSPPNVGNLSMKDEDYEDNGRPMKKSRSTNDDFYDNPPSYTFSLESAASFSKDQQFSTLPALPEKPRQSSYLGPLESKDKNDNGKDDLLLWEIKGQDSFPEGITPSFSFGKESSSGETENIGHADDMSKQDHNGRRSVQSHLSHDNNMKHEAETGNNVSKINDINKVNRTLSGTTKYPPRAASWVTGSSSFNRDPSHRMPTNLYAHNGTIPPPVRSYSGSVSMQSHHHRPGQMKQTGMLGNYSQDNSCGRSSPASSGVNSMASRYGPLHGPYGVPLPRHIAQSDAHLPPSFRPPVAALAGPVNIGRRAPPPAVYIMSSPPGGRPAGSHARHLSDSGDASKQQQQSGIYNWNKNDDSRLSEILKKFKNPKDWDSIAKEFGRGKTAKECHERWIRYLKPGVRKGQWQDHEDAIVVEAVTTSKEQPFTRWSDLAQRLPGRVGKQIRDRWVNHLNPNINHMPFTREDDLLLWDGHKKLGKRWVEISSKYFNSSRSENHIKNRWYSASFKKFVSNEFGPDAYSGGKKSGAKVKKGQARS